MKVENIFRIITSDIKGKITEINMIIEIMKLTSISFDRAIIGYRMMRESGMINEVIDKSTIGHLETMEQNTGLMLIISRFDLVPTNFNIGKWKPIQSKLMSEYKPNELIPKSKMTRIEISNWLSRSDKPTDSQNYDEFKRLYD
jgi:hypothetical protein